MDNNYSVYMHISPSGKRYIGITSKRPERRWRSGSGYCKNRYFYNAIQKYGWGNFEHEILFENLTKEEAEQIEINMISHYKSDDRNYGYNIERGGNCIGKTSEETRKKMSESHKGEKNHWYGKKLNDEIKQKMSNGSKNPSIETRLKRSKSLKKPVLQYSKNGEFIKRYDGAIDAELATGASRTHISQCCKNKRNFAAGYIWKYEEAA